MNCPECGAEFRRGWHNSRGKKLIEYECYPTCLENQIDKLRAALAEAENAVVLYACHNEDCAHVETRGEECDCGYDDHPGVKSAMDKVNAEMDAFAALAAKGGNG